MRRFFESCSFMKEDVIFLFIFLIGRLELLGRQVTKGRSWNGPFFHIDEISKKGSSIAFGNYKIYIMHFFLSRSQM